jgi:hypothetical protein
MKQLYSNLKSLLLILSFIFGGELKSQTTLAYQFYLDANANCNYDAGETLLYNLPGYISLTYTNTAAMTSTAWGSPSCTGTLALSSPSLPAANQFSLTYAPSSLVLSTSCPAYTNLQYTGTNYLPVTSAAAMSDVYFNSWATGYYSGGATGNTFPVCFNTSPSDSVSFSFNYSDLYGCGPQPATRTYSLYFDGTLYDQMTFTTTNTFSFTPQTTFSESNYNGVTHFTARTVLPAGISTLGAHTFQIKSTNLTATPPSSVNYTCTLNSVPCVAFSGSFYDDCNTNCVKDLSDLPLSYWVYGIAQSAGTTAYFCPDPSGNFSVLLNNSATTYSVSNHSYASSFTACTTATTTVPAGTSPAPFTFGWKTNSSVEHSSYLTRSAGAYTPAVTRTIGTHSWGYYFTSCTSPTVNPGKIKLLLDKNFSYVAPAGTTPVPNVISSGPTGDTLIWNVADFNAAPSINYSVTATISSTIVLGMTYTLSSFINLSDDTDLTNNSYTVVGIYAVSYDPNSKECSASGIQANGDIPFGVQDLYYTVHFQNVGTAPAKDVKVLDTMDVNLDLTTLKIVSSSFPVQLQADHTSRACMFYFPNIYLADSASNEPASHGYVSYKIKLNPGVPANTTIKNRAHNYFDFNAPVATNQTSNKLVIFSGIEESILGSKIRLLPNPFSDRLLIEAPEEILSVEILNSLGQIQLRKEINSNSSEINVQNFAQGIYFVSVKMKSGSLITKKVIKN